jgi:hypothetical protein
VQHVPRKSATKWECLAGKERAELAPSPTGLAVLSRIGTAANLPGPL